LANNAVYGKAGQGSTIGTAGDSSFVCGNVGPPGCIGVESAANQTEGYHSYYAGFASLNFHDIPFYKGRLQVMNSLTAIE
jgi:hypothetical protein